MPLGIVHVGHWFYKPISFVLMLCDIVPKSHYHRFVESFGLITVLWVVRRCRRVLDTKEFGYCCKICGHELRAVVRIDEGRDAIRYYSKFKEDVGTMCRCRFRRGPSPNVLRTRSMITTTCLFYL